MRYQERIYIQNDNRAVRNKDILNVNMSSDICIFKSPTFDVSGATKIQCGPIVCNLSGFSSADILSAATYDCFTSQGLSTECFSSVTWTTKIYEDSVLSYSGSYYTSNSLTGNTPLDTLFFNSLADGLYLLNYNYSLDDTVLTVEKPYGGAKELEYVICLTWNILSGQQFSCPAGFSATPSNDACQKITTSAATFNGVGPTIIAGDNNNVYNSLGSRFYSSIQNSPALPYYHNSMTGDLTNQTGGTLSPIVTVNTGTFWANPGNTTDGRLNPAGISATTIYAGFTYCLNLEDPGTYYLGVSSDNRCKFNLDGVQLIQFSGSVSASFLYHSVFELNLTSGEHIIEMLGENDASTSSAFCAEIYYPTGATPFATLTAATSTASTQANVIFTTQNFIGSAFTIGSGYGYSCSDSSFSINGCDNTFTCSKIETTGITSGATCTGTCFENCTVVCNDTFPYINSSSQGVYLLDTDISTATIPFTFNFTGNTEPFTANNATFSYKIYRYTPETGVFKLPPVYQSNQIPYSEISGVTEDKLTQSVPLSGLSIDGDYLIKGFFELNACTDFLSRLGKKINTDINTQGPVSQVYQESLDYYFVALRKAEVPNFTYSIGDENLTPFEGQSLFQNVIIVDDILSPPYPESLPDSPQDTPGPDSDTPIPLYFRTGSTFALSFDYTGDVVITLNGLTLSRDYDYTLTGATLTILGPVTNGDVITIIYTKIRNTPIIGETIYLTNTIPSGTTNNQGSNTYYYNTSTQKYEIYLKNTPLFGTGIIVVLNGITLVNNIDYYQSTSDSKRIILSGVIMVNDIITVIYYPTTSVINGITTTNNYIAWYVPTPPQKANGNFYLEYSNSPSFSTYTVSDTVPYIELLTSYSGILTLTGSVGTNYYYRVKNIKDYVSICGDVISSTAYSETVKVQIQSNAINSY